jgi:hypothetical protein
MPLSYRVVCNQRMALSYADAVQGLPRQLSVLGFRFYEFLSLSLSFILKFHFPFRT